MLRISRIEKAQKNLKDQQVEVLLIENPIDIFYLLGIEVSAGILAIGVDKAVFFTDGRYLSYAKQNVSVPVEDMATCYDFLAKFALIGVDSAFISYERFLFLQKKLANSVVKPIESPLQNLRIIKEAEEIQKIQQAQKLTALGIEYVVSICREGVTEEFLAWEFEVFCRKNGAKKLSFDPIIAFGKNSAYPHHRAGKAILEKNSHVLIDVGAVVDGYAGDMTRCFFFGQVDVTLQADYALIQKAQKAAIAEVKPGVSLAHIDQTLRDVLQKAGKEGLFTHSLGHGIGLQTHEKPFFRKGSEELQRLLVPGMVFTVEPGLYREGLGGVRFEDIVIVTESGHATI